MEAIPLLGHVETLVEFLEWTDNPFHLPGLAYNGDAALSSDINGRRVCKTVTGRLEVQLIVSLNVDTLVDLCNNTSYACVSGEKDEFQPI